jgi:chromosome segregation protein
MYLKRLELQGFKSFAPRSTLEFSPGITAIVGPNGSGKSNVADAIRWVLGEQSMRLLRGKKSDDVLFAGGQGRAAAQMAEVTLVLDNTAAWLPSERTEVTATRRSFRSGETEYLVNGQRTRLRDLLLLLAQARIGHDSYTVVGQGLIDQALSLRAEERRGLFEDAAGIRQFQAQRAEAEQKLGLTQTNLGRLRDIIAEIEPRLGPLAEQARRAREHASAREDLRRLLRTWYAVQWSAAQRARARAEAAEAAVAEQIEGIRAGMTVQEERIVALRPERDDIIARVNDQRRARGEMAGHTQTLERQLAVNQERRANFARQAADFAAEHGHHEARLATMRAQEDDIGRQYESTEADIVDLSARVETMEREQHSTQREREREEARLRAAQRDAVQARAEVAATKADLARLHRQRDDRAKTLAARQAAVVAAAARREGAAAALATTSEAFEATRQRVEDLVGQRDALAQAITDGERALDQKRAEVADARRERRAAGERLVLLEEWQRTLDDYPPGVREVLRAPEEDRPRLLGVLASLIQADVGYEAAVEAALGPFLHALVADNREDALACADWLRARHAGHAIVVWMPRAAPARMDALSTPAPGESIGGDVVGGDVVGGDVVGGDVGGSGAPAARDAWFGPVERVITAVPELGPLLSRLLNGASLARGLSIVVGSDVDDAARQNAGPQVTAGGEVLHPTGWIRGGAPATTDGLRAASLLERERALRELPDELARRDTAIAALEANVERATAEQRDRERRLGTLATELGEIEEAAKMAARDVAAVRRDEESASSDLQLSQLVAEQVAEELATADGELSAVATRATEHEKVLRATEERVSDIQTDLEEVAERNRERQEELARARTELAVRQQEAKALARTADQLHAQVRDLETQITRHDDRVEGIRQRSEELETAIGEQVVALEQSRQRIGELTDALHVLESTLHESERELNRLDREREEARREVERLEVEYRQRILEAQRARDAIATLVGQLREEWAELGDLATDDGQDDGQQNGGEPDDAAEPGAAALSLVTSVIGPLVDDREESAGDDSSAATQESGASAEEAARLRRQIDQLRGRMRHLRGYDPDAPQVYEELKTRHAFLNTQMRDMEQASVNLRTVIAELDATMRRQFTETFHAVNLRFQRHFTNLFSGGSARLELTAPRRQVLDDDDDDSTGQRSPLRGLGVGGVEVYVQIPGKRVQDLALLSGGERSMVSAALLFALLETNPPPFCLLDEVDAALDEANVVRFCETLRTLAEQTQFIVITHNRVTMTHAGAIYGISMGIDSISRMLSMQLAEVPATR